MKRSTEILPRLIRLRDAPDYLGMNRNKFNSEVRPFVTEVPLGKQAIAFDRLELDAWVDDYIQCNGRPGRLKGEMTWDVKDRQVSSNEAGSGISTSASVGNEFAKALEQLASRKLNGM